MKSVQDTLEDNLASFVAALEPDLGKMRRVAPGFVACFAEAALVAIVLEYALRKKGLLADDEITEALAEAQDALKRVQGRGGLIRAGSA